VDKITLKCDYFHSLTFVERIKNVMLINKLVPISIVTNDICKFIFFYYKQDPMMFSYMTTPLSNIKKYVNETMLNPFEYEMREFQSYGEIDDLVKNDKYELFWME